VVGTAKQYSGVALGLFGYAEGVDHDRPILALDVDGVISLFGFQEPLADVPGHFHLIDGMAHCIVDGIGERLARLADHYEIVWATGWEDRANDRLPEILGLPGKLPFLTFDGNARFGSAHWKIAAIDRYGGQRPLAWVDDCIDETCQAWAVDRPAPTLLVATEPDRGLTDEHVEALLSWVRAGYTA
jgi:Swiss Army Knife RNA repair-like protein